MNPSAISQLAGLLAIGAEVVVGLIPALQFARGPVSVYVYTASLICLALALTVHLFGTPRTLRQHRPALVASLVSFICILIALYTTWITSIFISGIESILGLEVFVYVACGGLTAYLMSKTSNLTPATKRLYGITALLWLCTFLVMLLTILFRLMQLPVFSTGLPAQSGYIHVLEIVFVVVNMAAWNSVKEEDF